MLMTGGRGDVPGAVEELTKEEFAKIEEVFAKFDVNGSGSIDAAEMKSAMRNVLGMQLSDEQVEQMVADIDINRSGHIEHREFLCMLAKKIMSRRPKPVQSKNIFVGQERFECQGVKTETYESQWAVEQESIKMLEAMTMVVSEPDTPFEESERRFKETMECDQFYYRKCFVQMAQQMGDETDISVTENQSNCNIEEMLVPARDGNERTVRVLIHRPKALTGQRTAACVYAHGGSSVGGSPELFSSFACGLAVSADLTVFSVDWGLAPEVKWPISMLDMYSTLKHVADNADELSIDKSKIILAGEDGGGYCCMATMAKVAENNEAHLVRLAFPMIPQVWHQWVTEDMSNLSIHEQLTKREAVIQEWLFGPDYKKDIEAGTPTKYPQLAPLEILRKFPPTCLYSVEFDSYKTMSEKWAKRLQEAGRLLEFIVVPGVGHNSPPQETRVFECFKMVCNAYVHSD